MLGCNTLKIDPKESVSFAVTTEPCQLQAKHAKFWRQHRVRAAISFNEVVVLVT
jgi:hypothetical protein